MATYLKGVQDYVPQLETFKPDYKFLSDVLSVRQDRYDTNYKQLNDLYSKVVYADMSREDNNAERDMYANQLSNGLKQVSGMDLSLSQNVDVAKGLFKPFFENKALVKDMTFTKQYQNTSRMVSGYEKSSQDEQRDRYWDDGVIDLQWQMEQFKSNDANAALSQAMPSYTENPNLYARSFEALKDSGLSIKQTTLEGDWIIQTQNGTALTRQIVGYEREQVGTNADGSPIFGKDYKKDEDGAYIPITENPAAEYLKETVMRDPIVMNGYRVQARNRARAFANNPENIQKYGSVTGANQFWANDVLKTQTNKDIKKLAELNSKIDKQSNTVANWETYKKQNNIIAGTAEEEVYLEQLLALDLAQKTKKLTSERIHTAKAPTSDLDQLMNVAYGQYMASQMGPLMTQAAIAYSQVDAEQTFEANPFKKMEHQHRFDLNKMAITHDYKMRQLHAKANYDRDNIDYENSLVQNSMGPMTGLMDATDTNVNITGKQIEFSTFEHNNEVAIERLQKMHNDDQSFILDMITSLPGSFQDVGWLSQSGSEMTYTIKNNAGIDVEKTASIDDALKDLSKPENDAEFKRILNNVRSKFENITTTTSGARLYKDLPELNLNAETQINLMRQYNLTAAQRINFNNAMNEMHKQYNQTYDWALNSNHVDVPGDVPLPLVTERQIQLAKDGIWSVNGETKISTVEGVETSEVVGAKYDQYDNNNRRMLTKPEYIDMFVNAMHLQKYQREAMDATDIRGNVNPDEDAFPWLVSDNGFFRDTKTTAQKFWRTEKKSLAGSGEFVYDMEDLPDMWVFDADAARQYAADKYDGANMGETGDGGLLGDMNAVMQDPDSGGENGLPGFDLNAYFIGQDYDGVGQTAFKTYTTTYDHYSKQDVAVNQLNAMFQSYKDAPSNTIMFNLGDTRTQVSEESDERAFAIWQAMKADVGTQYGKNDDRATRPVLTTSYVERMGGPDSEDDYAAYTIKPTLGTSNKYKAFFDMTSDAGKQNFQTLIAEGITMQVPSNLDNNPYKSINQVMSATDMIIEADNEFKSEVVGGGSYSIYKVGGQYMKQQINYGFDPSSGNIVPDPVYTERLFHGKHSLDALVITQDAFLAMQLRKNIALQDAWKIEQAKKNK